MRFKPWLILAALLFGVNGARAAPCTQVKAQPDAWITGRINALVQAARNAFETDNALPAYEKVLDGIVGTIRECRLSEDHNFVRQYGNFLDFVEASGLERRSYPELGFLVPDKQCFSEKRQYVGIPEFLLEPTFLRNDSSYETLGRAKSYLRQLNSSRGPDEQLIFFSYKSRHLGTPDNDDSYRRLLVVVPGNAEKGLPDKWVQFGITDPGKRTRVRNVSVVSPVTSANGTFNAYFKDFYRTYRREGFMTGEGRLGLWEGGKKCTMCSKSCDLPKFSVGVAVKANEQKGLLRVKSPFLKFGLSMF